MPKAWIKLIIIFSALTLALYWGYLQSPNGLDAVYKNWDGPSYVLAAKSLYVPSVAYENNFFHSVDIHPDWTWLPAHFPLFPLLIRAFSFIGYFQASLAISLLFSVGAIIAFYELAKRQKFVKNPLLLTLPLMVLSPRWFIASHVAGSDQIFIFFLILTLLFLQQRKMLPSAIFAALAQATRPQGSLLALGILLVAIIELLKTRNLKSIIKTYYPFLLVPLTLFLIFSFYLRQTGNFFAFFEAIAIFKHASSTWFATFSFQSPNVETFWQEVNAYDFVIFFVACLVMFRKKLSSFGIIGLTLFLPLIFIQHSDISRYALPLLPFAFLAFSEVIERKEFAIGSLLMSPAVITYAINFMQYNRAP